MVPAFFRDKFVEKEGGFSTYKLYFEELIEAYLYKAALNFELRLNIRD